MNWIKEQIAVFFDEHPDGRVEWVTPSEFPVIQDKRHLEHRRIKTQLLGEVIFNLVTVGEKDVNVDKHRNCSAPNFIHSMDAALLHMSFAGFDRPFTLIHDSILTTASDMGEMAKVIREQFTELYSGDLDTIPLAKFAKVLGVATPAHLILETMDVAEVGESTYFFC